MVHNSFLEGSHKTKNAASDLITVLEFSLCGALGLPYVEVNLMSLLCNGSLLYHTSLGLTFGQKYGLALCCPYVVGQPYVGSTLHRDDLMSGQPYVGSTLCRVNLMSGRPYVGLALCLSITGPTPFPINKSPLYQHARKNRFYRTD